MDDLSDFLSQVKSGQADIAEAEAMEFVENWKDVMVTVPATFVNWRAVAASVLVNLVAAGVEDGLGSWKEKATASPEVITAMGAFGNYTDALVDYINIERKSTAKQSILLFEKVGYLDLVMDNTGRESYIKTEMAESEEPAMIKCIDDVLEAFENFR